MFIAFSHLSDDRGRLLVLGLSRENRKRLRGDRDRDQTCGCAEESDAIAAVTDADTHRGQTSVATTARGMRLLPGRRTSAGRPFLS